MTRNREENALDIMYEHLNSIEEALDVEPTPSPNHIAYESGFMPLNRTHVIVGSIFYKSGARRIEVFETCSSILADLVYNAMREFIATLIWPEVADFTIEQYVRQDVPPGNLMMFTAHGELYQFEPHHAETVRGYDSRSEGLK